MSSSGSGSSDAGAATGIGSASATAASSEVPFVPPPGPLEPVAPSAAPPATVAGGGEADNTGPAVADAPACASCCAATGAGIKRVAALRAGAPTPAGAAGSAAAAATAAGAPGTTAEAATAPAGCPAA